MSSFGEDHRGVSVAPVVQALMDDLVARGAVRAGDVERAWNGRVPANSNEALASLETSGLITATQVGLLRSAFEERQRQNLGAVLAGAKTAGIVSDDGATVAVLGFEDVLHLYAPSEYLVRHGLITPAQADPLKSPTPGATAFRMGKGDESVVGIRSEVAFTIFALMAIAGTAAMHGAVSSLHYSFSDVRPLFSVRVTFAVIWVPLLVRLVASHLSLLRQGAFAVLAFVVANVGPPAILIPFALAGMRWLDDRPERRNAEMAIGAGLGVALLVLQWLTIEMTSSAFSSYELERALEGRGEQYLVFCVLTLMKGILAGTGALFAAWCVRGGQRFATTRDVMLHFTDAKWTWPLLAWVAGGFAAAVLSVVSDNGTTFEAFCALVILAGGAAVVGLAIVSKRQGGPS
jgi:hypothetical protein